MKTLHVPVEADIIVDLPKGLLEKLPMRVALFTTAQFLGQYEKMASALNQCL